MILDASFRRFRGYELTSVNYDREVVRGTYLNRAR